MRLRKKPWIETAMEELKDKYVLMHNLEDYKGHWQERFPGKRLCLEIGCGKGRFLTGMAELHPEKAFIRRLTHRNFLAKYQRLLGSGGHLRFKTDNRALFDFSVEEFKEFGLEIIALSYDLHHSEYENEVQTEYEQKFSALGTPINFCEVVFK